MKVLRIQFWAEFWGYEDVYIDMRSGASAERIARLAVNQAVAKYDKRWVFPKYAQRKMRCVGMFDGERTLNARDMP